MKWTRMRTWAGRHPVWAVNLATAFTLLVCVLLLVVTIGVLLRGRTIAFEVAKTVLIPAILSLLFLAGTTSTAFVSLLLARAGLGPRRVLLAAAWVPLFAASGIAMWLTVGSLVLIVIRGNLGGIDWPAVLIGWVVVSVTLAGGYLVGWMIAALFVRYKIRKGQWETTKPVELN